MFLEQKKYLLESSLAWLLLAFFSGCSQPQHLDSKLSEFVAIQSALDVAVGGATMTDVISQLRYDHSFPVSFEELEYSKDALPLTLALALRMLEEFRKQSPLSPADQQRYHRYLKEKVVLERLLQIRQEGRTGSEDRAFLQQWEKFYNVGEGPEQRILGPLKKTFQIVEKQGTIKSVLDRAIEADSNYEWLNVSLSDKRSFVLVRPKKRKTALDGLVAELCPELPNLPRTQTVHDLYTANSALVKLLLRRGFITLRAE